MFATVLIAIFITPVFANETAGCDQQETKASKLTCSCIRQRDKSTIYIRGKRLPYVNTVANCSDNAKPTLVWIPAANMPQCPVIDCHESEDP